MKKFLLLYNNLYIIFYSYRELPVLIYLEHTEFMIAIMFNINIDNMGVFEWVYTYGFVKISS